MLNLMVDKETLALHVNAVIVQIGLVVFDANFTPVSELKLNIDITSSLLDGFEVDPKTARDFWAKQPTAVKQSVLFAGPRIPPRDAANILDKWLKDTFKGENFTIWANGILFDIPKFDHFFHRYGLKALTDRTRYNLVYDYRTIRAAVEQLYPKHLEHAKDIMKNDMSHDALADCHYQVGMLDACMAILAGEYQMIDDDLDMSGITEGLPKSVVTDIQSKMADFDDTAGIHDSVLLDSIADMDALACSITPPVMIFTNYNEEDGSTIPMEFTDEYSEMEQALAEDFAPPQPELLVEDITLTPVAEPEPTWDDSGDDNSFAESVVYADVTMRQPVIAEVPKPAPFHHAV